MTLTRTDNSAESKQHHWDVNYSVAIMRAAPTAVLAGVITNPIKIWQFKKTINEPVTFQHIMKTAPLRGAQHGIGIHFMGAMVIFNGVPLAKKALHEEEWLSPSTRHMMAFSVAGMFESLIVSRPNIYLQKIYASSLAEKPKAIFKMLQPKEIHLSWRASVPYYLVGAAIFYGVWGSLVRKSEKELLVEDQQATVSKGIEEFMIGGIAAIVASSASFPVNSYGNRRAHNPQLTFKQDFIYAWETFGSLKEYAGVRMIFQHFYRGFSVNLLRVPIAMGIMNWGKFFGDEMYKKCGFFAEKKKVSLQQPVDEEEFDMLFGMPPF